MGIGGTYSAGVRVVVLSAEVRRIEAELKDSPAGLQCVRVATAYEAAAELLAEPAAALVIDLRRLAGRHLRLVQVARQMDVEMLAFGTLPAGMSTEELNGVRLVSRAELPAELERLTRLETTAEAPAAGAVKLTPAKKPADQPVCEPTAELPEKAPELDEAAPPAASAEKQELQPPKTDLPDTPSGVLTPEELAALLEHER